MQLGANTLICRGLFAAPGWRAGQRDHGAGGRTDDVIEVRLHAAKEVSKAPTTDSDEIGVAATSGFGNDVVNLSGRDNHRSLSAREELKIFDFLENVVAVPMRNTSCVPF